MEAILLHGLICAGKGVQKEELVKFLEAAGYTVRSEDMGDMIRSMKGLKTDFGQRLFSYSQKGESIPWYDVAQVWKDYLTTVPLDTDFVVLSGTVRTGEEEVVEFINHTNGLFDSIKVFELEISEEVARKRLVQRATEQNRTDDKDEEAIQERFRVYREITQLALRKFQGYANELHYLKYYKINGNQNVTSVTEAITSILV